MEKKDIPIIKVVSMIDNQDGTCTVEFETNDAFDKFYLKETGKKRVTKKGLGNYIIELLTNAIEEKDGYAFKKYQFEK